MLLRQYEIIYLIRKFHENNFFNNNHKSFLKLVPKTISGECFELAMTQVISQTEPVKNKEVRTEYSYRSLSPDAKSVLGGQ